MFVLGLMTFFARLYGGYGIETGTPNPKVSSHSSAFIINKLLQEIIAYNVL